MATLPTPGSPDVWGTTLNNWLTTDHDAGASHKSSLYHAEVWQTTLQSITNNSVVQLAWDTVEADPNSNFTTGASAKYTCPVAGRYLVTASALFASALWVAGTVTYLTCFVQASERKRGPQTSMPAVTDLAGPHPLSVIVRCSASDTIDIRLFQNNGAAINTSPGQAIVWAQFSYIGTN